MLHPCKGATVIIVRRCKLDNGLSQDIAFIIFDLNNDFVLEYCFCLSTTETLSCRMLPERALVKAPVGP